MKAYTVAISDTAAIENNVESGCTREGAMKLQITKHFSFCVRTSKTIRLALCAMHIRQ